MGLFRLSKSLDFLKARSIDISISNTHTVDVTVDKHLAMDRPKNIPDLRKYGGDNGKWKTRPRVGRLFVGPKDVPNVPQILRVYRSLDIRS